MNLLVQTDRILANYRILNKQAGGTPLIPVLEANAYGPVSYTHLDVYKRQEYSRCRWRWGYTRSHPEHGS